MTLLAGACVHPRQFSSPRERLTPQTAYAEQALVRVDVGALEPDPQRFVANVGVTAALVPGRLDFSVNFAHAVIGAVSLQSKFTLIDLPHYGLGGRVGINYTNPSTYWFLSADLRDELGGFSLVSAPIELWQSFPVSDWFTAHLGVGYRATGAWGDYAGDALALDATLAQRSVLLWPVLDFFVAERVALRFAARLPVYSQFVEATDALAELQPDVFAGLRSVEWIARPLARTYQLEFAAETRFGENTHLRVGVHLWAFRPLSIAVTPSLNLYWRFG